MFMEVQVCKHCRRLFQSVSGSNVCPNCYVGLEADFKTVKRYIRSHPNSTIVEVAEACEMEMAQIRQWIKDERIEYTKNSVIGIECEKCGVSIKTGRLCTACKNETTNILKSVYVKKKVTDSEGKVEADTKMRFLNKNHDRKNE